MKLSTLFLTGLFSFNTMASMDFGALEQAPVKELPVLAQELNNMTIAEHELFERPSHKSFTKNIPDKKMKPYDPIEKKYYQKVMVGKTFKASMLSSYTHWRYVTVYNVKTLEERIAYLPYFQEECYDNSLFMGQWGETRSMKVTFKTEVGASASVGALGLSASVGMSIEEGVSFSAQRRIRAVEGIQARHYPYKLSDTWEGVTYIQTYNEKTKKYGYLDKSIADRWFGGYPYGFFLDNQNIGMSVKRVILKKCENYNPSDDPIEGNEYDPSMMN